MRVQRIWTDKELEEMWTPDRKDSVRKEERECYLISPFDGQEAEFCSGGDIKVMIFSGELKYSKYLDMPMPSKEEIELFYHYDRQLHAYIPILCNARLL